MKEAARREASYPVNGQSILFSDWVITGREALTKSGHVPASEHKLILVRGGRTRLIGADDDVDLKKEGGGALRAFLSDRSFSFTVDEVSQVWGAEEMEVDEFLTIWPARQNHEWVLEQDDEPDTVLSAGGVLAFGPSGVEDVVSRKAAPVEKVLITVVTTAGTFPAEGFKRYPTSTPIAEVLADAKRKLGIADSETWIVTVGGRDIDSSLTLAQAGFSGHVALEWGAREGGGGA